MIKDQFNLYLNFQIRRQTIILLIIRKLTIHLKPKVKIDSAENFTNIIDITEKEKINIIDKPIKKKEDEKVEKDVKIDIVDTCVTRSKSKLNSNPVIPSINHAPLANSNNLRKRKSIDDNDYIKRVQIFVKIVREAAKRLNLIYEDGTLVPVDDDNIEGINFKSYIQDIYNIPTKSEPVIDLFEDTTESDIKVTKKLRTNKKVKKIIIPDIDEDY